MLGIVVTDNFDFEIIAEFHLKVMEEYTRAISKGSLMMPSCLKRTDLQDRRIGDTYYYWEKSD